MLTSQVLDRPIKEISNIKKQRKEIYSYVSKLRKITNIEVYTHTHTHTQERDRERQRCEIRLDLNRRQQLCIPSSHSHGVVLTITGPSQSWLQSLLKGGMTSCQNCMKSFPSLASWHQALAFSFPKDVNPEEILISGEPFFTQSPDNGRDSRNSCVSSFLLPYNVVNTNFSNSHLYHLK